VVRERRAAVRQTVELAHALIAHQHQEAVCGGTSMDEAQARAAREIKQLIGESVEQVCWRSGAPPT